jgi:hypothetical protein
MDFGDDVYIRFEAAERLNGLAKSLLRIKVPGPGT